MIVSVRSVGPTQLRVGSRLGKYKILNRLGGGGISVVYRARDTVQGMTVALKVPPPHARSEQVLDVFRAEAKLHSRMDHPNIIPVKNADWIDGTLVIVYPAGEESLADRIRRRLSVKRCLWYAEQMIEAVAYAHDNRIIHCDLKPENFILFPDDQLQLSDFGISKIAVRTVHGSGSGTLGYVAPEQAMGRASFRSDVFSLGLILYEMLAGEIPEWPFEWPPSGYQRLRKKAHPELVSLIRKAISMDPRKRYPHGRAMLRAFRPAKTKTLRLHAGKRNRPSNANSSQPHWKEVRWRQFLKSHGKALAINHKCPQCAGPLSEFMSFCPWCGRESTHSHPASFPARCPRCKRGRKLDWKYCAWCYGASFREVSDRGFSDRRYSARCAGKSCRGRLMPFMRYCPWCRRKVRNTWPVPGSSARCPRCRWGVLSEFWDRCPWCVRSLRRE